MVVGSTGLVGKSVVNHLIEKDISGKLNKERVLPVRFVPMVKK